MKTYTFPLTVVLALTSSIVFAQDGKPCDDANLELVISEVESAPAAAKEAAMKELEMAKEKMAEGDADACSVHLTMASNFATGN